MAVSSADSQSSSTPGSGRDDISLRIEEIKALLKTLEDHAHAANVAETQAATDKTMAQTMKTVLRRLLRPIWERQTSYNLANTRLGEKFTQLWLESQECQSNLYLRSIQVAEEKLDGLIRLVEEELSLRDQRIDDLDKRVRQIEARNAQE